MWDFAQLFGNLIAVIIQIVGLFEFVLLKAQDDERNIGAKKIYKR